MIESAAPGVLIQAMWALRSTRHLKEKRLSSAEPSPRRKLPDVDQTLAAVANGDRSAFASLYDQLSPAVYGLARRVVRSSALAEDVTQEVFLEVWRKADAWHSHRSSATTWVLMIARARAVDRVRSEQATRDRQDRIAPGWLEPPNAEPAESLELEEERDGVRSALSMLTDKQRIVIKLAYYEGKTYVEVAEDLGLPVGTVKTRMRDGLMRMREIYGVRR